MSKLAIASDLALPLDAVTQKLAFLGRTGSGKTYAATKLAEEMLKAGAQVLALDPVGVWYGLRIAADGKGAGIQIPVFGGLHADVPIEPTGGGLIADLIVDRGLSAVIDVSQFESDAQKARFATEFAHRLFFRKKAAPSPVMLFLEECQEFIPQNPDKDETKMLHDYTRLIKLGRNFGIGLAMISQRPQEVNKKCLNLTECMFAFQMTGPHERKTIRSWVEEKGADLDIVDALPKFRVGEAHVWSPQWLRISKTVHIDPKWTFNSSSTPAFGSAKRIEPKPLDISDMEKLREQMAATIERAKAADPAELKKQLAAAQKKLAEIEKQAGKEPTPSAVAAGLGAKHQYARGYAAGVKETAKAYAVKNTIIRGELLAIARETRLRRDALGKEILRVQEHLGLAAQAHNDLIAIANRADSAGPLVALGEAVQVAAPAPAAPHPAPQPTPEPMRHPSREPAARIETAEGELTLRTLHRSILTALAQHPRGLAKNLILLHSGYRSSGDVSMAFAALQRHGLVDPDGPLLRITHNGIIALGEYEPLPVGSSLREWLLSGNKLSRLEKALLTVVCDAAGEAVPKGEILRRAGYKSSGDVSMAFARLVRYGYAIAGPGGLQMAKQLSDDAYETA